MPEIPFLEAARENLARRLNGRRIDRIDVRQVYILKSVVPPLDDAFGRRIDGVRRRGKYLIGDLEGGLSLLIHLMKAGRLRQVDGAKKPSRDTALRIHLDDATALDFTEAGSKKRASLRLAPTVGLEDREPLASLGLEPLSDAFTVDALHAGLAADRATLKHFLTQQRPIAGIGNGYGDEILWEARLSPFARTDALSDTAAGTLHEAIQSVLRRGVAENRAAFGDALPLQEPVAVYRVHRRGGEACPRCGDEIRFVAYAERETYYCPTCQAQGKVYADRRLSRLLR